MTGRSGYDVVEVTANIIERLIAAGALCPLLSRSPDQIRTENRVWTRLPTGK